MNVENLRALVSELSIDELALLRDLADIRLAHEGKLCARCGLQMGYDDESDLCTSCVRAVYLEIEWKHALANRHFMSTAAAGWKLARHRFEARRHSKR